MSNREDTTMDATTYRLVRNLKAGDRVHLSQGHPVQLTEVEHLGGGLTVLYGPDGFQVRKDGREAVFIAR